MRAAVERAINTMWDHYNEPLSLADLADTAILSKFYFSRVFRDQTGTSPGRFLTAIRLFKAKGLLQHTLLSVTDISYQVGYNSLGTFTSRFTRSVGMSPARFRAFTRTGIHDINRPPAAGLGQRVSTVTGSVTVPPTEGAVRVYVGAFKEPIVQGFPVACAVLNGPGRYRLDALPDGLWYVRATVLALDSQPRRRSHQPLFVGSSAPMTVRSGRAEADIDTRPLCLLDMPILLALPELDCHFSGSACTPAASSPWSREARSELTRQAYPA
ncbi:helix-turn-helix transcriptional regulator [Kitasatospora sp. NPDC088548]|uniref:helix-turn-helix transcriptional regulator n=1 Tax=Kitasatospora sp. NPDC088548 TaxID=3364075 RepID=UPI003804FEAA